jgi:hypothetical protein
VHTLGGPGSHKVIASRPDLRNSPQRSEIRGSYNQLGRAQISSGGSDKPRRAQISSWAQGAEASSDKLEVDQISSGELR